MLPVQQDAPNRLALQHGPRPLPLFLAHLWRESENDPVLRRNALRGLRRYEEAARPSPPHHGAVGAQCGAARLLHMGSAQKTNRPAIILIPSLINPPNVLDLGERSSLARYLADQGHDPWLLDWGTPDASDSALGLSDHVEQRLIPMLRSIGKPVILVGYCLGGTMALAAAQRVRAQALVTIAAPWYFNRYPEADLNVIATLWHEAKPLCERLGYVPMEVLQTGFWALDPARTIRKYAAFAEMEDGSDEQRAFLAVEDWANEGAPLTFAAARELFEDLYAANASGAGLWAVGGETIQPASLSCPSLSISSATDRIVPASASPALMENRESSLGHVGMIVSRKAPSQIWQPLSQWLSAHGG